jgi:hypothetical protein
VTSRRAFPPPAPAKGRSCGAAAAA